MNKIVMMVGDGANDCVNDKILFNSQLLLRLRLEYHFQLLMLHIRHQLVRKINQLIV